MRSLLPRAGVSLTVLLLAAGCEPAPLLSPEDHRIAGDALEYLRTTEDELGLDALVFVQAYGDLTSDARAEDVVEARRADLRASDVERYGVLLDTAKPVFGASTLEGIPPPDDSPDPRATLDDDRVQRCVDAMVRCEIPPDCLDYAELRSWGYVLTHQAVWLLFAHWLECEQPLEEDALRHFYASRILAEARFDPTPSDLFFERLGVLGHLGFGAEIDPAWVDALRAAQSADGCFPANDEVRCHPHPTALALWTLAHAVVSGR